jgi:hypothetical protein
MILGGCHKVYTGKVFQEKGTTMTGLGREGQDDYNMAKIRGWRRNSETGGG